MISAVATQSQAKAAESPAAGPSPKLVKAARDFEALLLQDWLEKMNQSFVGESASQDPGHDTLSSLGSQAIATALAARGGIGIANTIVHQLQRRSQTAPTGEQTGGRPTIQESGKVSR